MKNTETQNNKMTKKELVKFLVENFVKNSTLNLSNLDFTKEDIKEVIITGIRVNGVLFQDSKKVNGKQ